MAQTPVKLGWEACTLLIERRPSFVTWTGSPKKKSKVFFFFFSSLHGLDKKDGNNNSVCERGTAHPPRICTVFKMAPSHEISWFPPLIISSQELDWSLKAPGEPHISWLFPNLKALQLFVNICVNQLSSIWITHLATEAQTQPMVAHLRFVHPTCTRLANCRGVEINSEFIVCTSFPRVEASRAFRSSDKSRGISVNPSLYLLVWKTRPLFNFPSEQ